MRTMRKRLRAILPQSKAPSEAMRMPKAAPLFSMKRSWNQSGMTTIDSPRHMWVLIHILSA